jgi:hypothetical protein
VTVEFETAVALTHFTVTSSNDTPARDPRAWSISGSNDGVSFTPLYRRDSDTTFWALRNQVVRFDLPAPSSSYKFIRYTVTRTGSAQHALAEIEYFGIAGAAVPFEIKMVDHDSLADTFRLTWTSRPGKIYVLRWNTDLLTWPFDINDSIQSQGETTTYPPVDQPPFANPSPLSNALFFRIEEG